MPVDTCSAATIKAYLDESLSPAQEASLECHLNSCDTCRERMSQLAGSGDDWTSIAGALRSDEFDDESAGGVHQPSWPIALLGPTDDPRMLGRIGPFEVSGCVGVGGMGIVFKARDPALDRFVAVKVLAPHLASSENARRRFAREAKAAAAVVHDNVIAIHQVSEYQGLPFLVMPYLPGPSLAHRIARRGPLAPVEALRVARQVAAGLRAAHQQGLIHRDIKPANVLLSGETERAVITDFGLARAADDATLTRSGTLAGTPQFMAPEQARGEPTDERSDLYSLGALLFAMLTGRAPVEQPTGAETIRIVGQMPPPKLSSVLKNVPTELERLVDRLHAFDRSQRISTAEEAELYLADELPTAGREPLSVGSADNPNSLQQPGSHRVLLAAIACCLTLLIGTIYWVLPESDPPGDGRVSTPQVVKTPQVGESVLEVPVTTDDSIDDGLSAKVLRELSKVVEEIDDADGQLLDTVLQSIETELEQLEERRGW